MVLKSVKIGAIGLAGFCLIGGFIFGADLLSYVSSSARSVQSAVKDAVPVEFELKRARDLLEDIIPEMQANVRLIAQEEVEVAGIKADVERHQNATSRERLAVATLRDALNAPRATVTLAGRTYRRDQVKAELARRFDGLKEAELVLGGKQRLLDTRQKSLKAAMQMLDRTRSQKARLETQIEGLDAQYRLVKAASVGSRFHVDHSKLAQTEKLIRDIKKRLDVAERILSHEARFVEPIPVDTISEEDLIAQVDDHLSAEDLTVETAGGGALALDRAGQID
ncbi:MAG: hypothetical protein JXQ73_20260 [Phycisphaerae bacterium]|nr:hypothetical protein [Phycisphaerae bacterium]